MVKFISHHFSPQDQLPYSHSTLGSKWGPPGDVDDLGRPIVWLNGGEKEERKKGVESDLKTSNMSLVCVSM